MRPIYTARGGPMSKHHLEFEGKGKKGQFRGGIYGNPVATQDMKQEEYHDKTSGN